MSKDPSDTELMARYESLRRESASLDVRSEEIDSELVEIERRLPDYYYYPGDPIERCL